MCLTRSWGILYLTILLISCGSQSSADQLAKELQTVASWIATAHMVGKAWNDGNVPTPYTQRTLQAAEESLQEEADKLTQTSKIPPNTRRTALELLRNVKTTLGQMQPAVEGGDRTALSRQLNQLEMQRQRVIALTKNGGHP